MNFHLFVNTSISLATAFVLGGLIGFERQWRQRTAGLRTNVLVAVGAAAFVDLGLRMGAGDGAVRVISYVVSGIGFLGAGVIMKEGAQVRGINTAATLWSSAAVGAFAGSGEPVEAALVAIFMLAGNTLLRPVANYVNRKPISPNSTEAVYRIYVTCRPDLVSEATAISHP
jgi:putative Mg2+ transporter-C (MgtC) family protein